MKDISVYIHIPFCVRKCLYCDFLSEAADSGNRRMEEYKNALLKQIRSSAYFADDFTIRTIFFGGGTPSLYDGTVIAQILETLCETFEKRRSGSFRPEEITIECNPGTVDTKKFLDYKKAGINRLSIGLQSADNSELKTLGRIHTYEDWQRAADDAFNAGFVNISTDLISGIPGQSVANFEHTLNKVLKYDLSHISVYSLIIEEGTPFFEMYKKDDEWDDTDRDIYELTNTILKDKGYQRYEISNYAKKGYECMHNMVYWDLNDYLGLGVGAASMINNVRIKNTGSINDYINDPVNCICEKNILTKEDIMSEYFILGLRKSAGVSLKRFYELYNMHANDVFGPAISKWIKNGLLIMDGDMLKCSEKGFNLNNMILLDFIP